MPDLEHLAQATENLAIQNEALRKDVKELRLELHKRVKAAINSTLVVGAVGLVAGIAAITSLFVFRSFKADINSRSLASCINFNSDRLDQRNGLKALMRGLVPSDEQTTPDSKTLFAVFDSFVNNGWRFRDCSPKGIAMFQDNTHEVNIDCKTDGKGFCNESTPSTIPPRSASQTTEKGS